jgi:hypothetical protein
MLPSQAAAISGALVGVLGTACVSSILFYFTRKEAKWTATTGLYADFNSQDMSEARNKAVQFLRTRLEKDYGSLDYEMHQLDEISKTTTEHLKVMRFYQRLFVLQSTNRLVDKALFELFASVFGWWWGFSFEKQLCPTEWQAARQLERLCEFFEAKAVSLGRSEDWVHWIAIGREIRESH